MAQRRAGRRARRGRVREISCHPRPRSGDRHDKRRRRPREAMRLIRSVIFVIWLYGSKAVIGLAMLPWVAANERYVWVALRAWTRTILFGLRWIVRARVKFE